MAIEPFSLPYFMYWKQKVCLFQVTTEIFLTLPEHKITIIPTRHSYMLIVKTCKKKCNTSAMFV